MVRGERVCASRSHSEKSSGRPPPKSTSLRRKKQRTTQSGPWLIASATMLFAVLRTPPLLLFAVLRSPLHRRTVRTYVCSLRTYVRLVGSTTSRGRTHRPRQKDTHCASGLAAQRQRKVRRIRPGRRSTTTRCEGHAFENRCCRMNDIASQIQRKEERQELT